MSKTSSCLKQKIETTIETYYNKNYAGILLNLREQLEKHFQDFEKFHSWLNLLHPLLWRLTMRFFFELLTQHFVEDISVKEMRLTTLQSDLSLKSVISSLISFWPLLPKEKFLFYLFLYVWWHCIAVRLFHEYENKK